MKRAERFLLACLIGVLGVTTASVAAAGKGVRAGVNLATFSGADADTSGVDKGSRTGIAAGAFMSFGLAGLVAVQPEVLYSQKGATYSAGGQTYERDLDYVTLSLLGRVSPGMFGVTAGPSLGILVSAKAKDPTGTTDIKDTTAKTDLGVVVGIGVSIPLGLSLDVRYNLGLASVDDDGVDPVDKVFNSGLSILAGFSF